MRKLSISFLLMLGLFTTVFISCSDDDDTPPILDPEITGISPEEGPVGTPVTITGLNFGEDPTVTFGSEDAEVSNASPTSITTEVPEGVAVGDVTVTVNNDGATDTETFTVTEEEDPDGGDGDGDGDGDGELPGAGTALDTIEVLSTLNAAVDAAELTETLDDADNVTIFAPNNAAFANLLTLFEVSEEDGVQGLIDTLTAEGVSGVLQAHVVGESLDAAAVTEAAGNDSLETLNGAMIGITEVDGTLFANDAEIVRNIEVANGFIHVIDSVINTDVVGGEEGEGEGEEDVIVPDQTQVAEDDPARDVALELIDNFNAIQDVGVSLTSPIPSSNLGFVTSQLAELPEGDFFTEVDYKGAFDPDGTNWLDGWSLLSRGGYLGGTASDNTAAYSEDEIVEDDGDDDDGDGENDGNLVELSGTIDATDGFSMTADNIYRIDGYTFVENGELSIEAGTRIIAETDPTNEDPVSALIITRSATINAQGTAEDPIIMTSENDFEGGPLDENSASEWGGLVILGEARANKEGASLIQIEGIPESIPALYGAEGGNFVDDDDSGTLRYVSIRYTGDEIASGNELQGLTLGGVGSGTTIEYVESFASSDDGIEIFGGSPNIRYFAVGFAQDDSYDFDLGFNGSIQFAYALQGQSADNLIEWDGADNDDNDVFSDPTLYNMTMVSTGVADQALVLRDNTAGVLANSIIFADNTRGIVVEDLPNDDVDSYQRLINGEIELLNNLWFFGDTFVEFNSTDAGIVQTVVPD